MTEQALSREVEESPAAHVVTLSRTRDLHDALFRAFALGGAVIEEVAELPLLLARLRRAPRPDLVVLGWETGGETGEMLRWAAESREPASLLLLAAEPAAGFAPAGAAGQASPDPAAAAEREPALLRILRSGAMPTAAGDAAAQRTAPTGAAAGLALRFDTSRAFWKGRRVELSLTEFRIVSRLARAGGQDVSHRELYDIIKGEGFMSGTGTDGYRCNVRAAVKRIRQKFRLADPAFAAIRSYHGFGYRWDEAAGTASGEENEA